MAYNFRENWVFRGGFAVNTLDLWMNGLRENFDEYLATASVQRSGKSRHRLQAVPGAARDQL